MMLIGTPSRWPEPGKAGGRTLEMSHSSYKIATTHRMIALRSTASLQEDSHNAPEFDQRTSFSRLAQFGLIHSHAPDTFYGSDALGPPIASPFHR